MFLGVSNVLADDNDFVPDPKPEEAHHEDQFQKHIDEYLSQGYVQVEVKEHPHIEKMIEEGIITEEEQAEVNIIILEHPNPPNENFLLENCTQNDNLIADDFSVQNCWGSPRSTVHIGPILRNNTNYPSEGKIESWHSYETYFKPSTERIHVKPTFNQVRYWRGDSGYTIRNARAGYELHGNWFCTEKIQPHQSISKSHTVTWASTNWSYYYTWGRTDFTFPTNQEPVYNLAALTQARWSGDWYRNGVHQFYTSSIANFTN